MNTSKVMGEGPVKTNFGLKFVCLAHYRFEFRKLKADKNVFLEKYCLPKRKT